VKCHLQSQCVVHYCVGNVVDELAVVFGLGQKGVVAMVVVYF